MALRFSGPRGIGHRVSLRPITLVFALALAAAPAVMAKGKHAERDGIGILPLEDIKKLGGKRPKVKPGRGLFPTPSFNPETPGIPDSPFDIPLPTTSELDTTEREIAAAVVVGGRTITIDPRRSLIVTDSSIMNSFPILTVLNRLAAGSPQSMIARQLYDQWMDLHNAAPGIGQGGHCNDQTTNGVATLNGFQYDCPRAEGRLVGTNPTDGNPDSFRAVAVVNRFDLATDPRRGGTDCGEYRIIYAKRSGQTVATNRMQIIFEGVLPNPRPNGVDLSGCRPVAEFWANLSTISDPAVRATQLRSFFFTGLSGFAPVVRAAHYGFATPNALGQIRTNLFMQSNWVLREYRLTLVNNRLKMVSLPNHQSPAGLLFNETNPHAKGADFRNQFLNVVQSLAINDINRFNSNTLPNRFDSGDGDQQDANENNYPAQFSRSPNFTRAVQGRLTTMGSTLTPAQIVQRSLAMSCAGCHQLSNGRNLGGGLVWPASLQFVHVSEAQPESGPNGQRFRISQALTSVFLPHRQRVFEAFLNGTGSP
jgi:hypothetical protein